MTEDSKTLPPYISFKTIINLADRIQDGIPPRIDKSVLSYLSSGYRVQVITTLRTLSFIDDTGAPSDDFQDFIAEAPLRQRITEGVWRRYYADVFATVDVARATADQLSEAFTKLGVAGDTRAKAMIFFVHGAKFADIPVSALIVNGIKRVRGSGAGRTRRRETGGDGIGDAATQTTLPPRPTTEPEIPVHAYLRGAIVWLAENGPHWSAENQQMWIDNFVGSVKLVYPAQRGRPESTEEGG
jgi:hypothetical protein